MSGFFRQCPGCLRQLETRGFVAHTKACSRYMDPAVFVEDLEEYFKEQAWGQMVGRDSIRGGLREDFDKRLRAIAKALAKRQADPKMVCDHDGVGFRCPDCLRSDRKPARRQRGGGEP